MRFDNPLDYYQAIAEELNSIVSESWKTIEVLATRYENSINLEIVYFRPDGSEESRVRPILLDDYFFELAECVSDSSKGFYKTCKFRLLSDGKFDVNFEYQT
jgi:hypothetical protein